MDLAPQFQPFDAPANESELRQDSRNVHLTRLVNCLMFVGFTLAAVPESLQPEPLLTGFYTYLWPLLLGAVLSLIRPGAAFKMRLFVIFVITGAVLTVLGMARVNDFNFRFKSLAGDISIFIGAVAGMAWASQRSLESIIINVRAWATVTMVITLLVLAALLTGRLTPASGEARLFVYSLYLSSWLLTVSFPFLYHSSLAGYKTRLLYVVISIFSIATVFAIGIVSTTRSVFLGGIGSISAWLFLGFRTASLLGKIATIALAIVFSILFSDTLRDGELISNLTERLSQTSVEEEVRFLELQEMFSNIPSAYHFIFGMGFGMSFTSDVARNFGEDRVLNPHVGVLTLLYKGGYVFFILCMIVPFVFVFTTMTRLRVEPLIKAAAAGVILYYFLASMSGGWTFYSLFLFGVFWASHVAAKEID